MPMLKFNVKNVKYAVPDVSGSYSGATVESLGGANSLSLEAQYSEKEVNADGKIAYILASDKGLNGTLSMTAIEDAYEIAMGRKLAITDGIADIEQIGTQPHALYFEANGTDGNGATITIKAWLFNVTSGKPNEKYDQNTDAPNTNPYDMSVNVLGTVLKDTLGTSDYTDANGNTRKVWKLTAVPTDTNYATFGDAVPVPKAKA